MAVIRSALPASWFNEEAKFTEQSDAEEDESHGGHSDHVTSS